MFDKIQMILMMKMSISNNRIPRLNNNKKQNKNEQSQLNVTYRLFLPALISCIISVPNEYVN